MKNIKFEIIKILRNAMVTSITTPNVATLLKENDEIADEIVKLLAAPAVSVPKGTACDVYFEQCEHWINNPHQRCFACNKLYKQAAR